ncbi:Homeobox protein homothorax [Erysiphe necator]|nr:Homeobox protein homothorax [Erysiphe necator]
MLPSLPSFTKFEYSHNASKLPYRTCASSEHHEQLPSIFELVPELSKESPRDFHLAFRRESEPRCYEPRNYQVLNTCAPLSSSNCHQSKRRRLSVDEDEDMRRLREVEDFRSRDKHFSGPWSYFQQTNAPTPDPSPSSRRSSTFSSNETWTESPPSNRFTNISSQTADNESSPFSRTETQSRPDSHRGLGNNSSPNFSLHKDPLEVNVVNGSHLQDRYLHRLSTLNLAHLPQRPSCSSRTDKECYHDMPVSMAHSSLPNSELPYSSDSKMNSFRGYLNSDTVTYTASSQASNQFSKDGLDHKAAAREYSIFQGESGHESYAENVSHFNSDDVVGARENKPRKRRGNLPKDTTDKLRTWFLNHLEHPYPTEDEKQQLMDSTGLQMNQISNWYINARRRQLPAITANARAEAEARRHIQRSPNTPKSKKCEGD